MISSFRIRTVDVTYHTLRYFKPQQIRKDVNMFKKTLDKMAVKKKKTGDPPQRLLTKGFLPSAYGNVAESRRLTVLNKVYMECIMMMINSGKYGSQFSDLGIEITKVNLTGDLNYLNVHWISRRTDIPEVIVNEVLNGTLMELQQEMGGIRFTVKIPLVRFVKDLRLDREIQLEKIFQAADFGKDFEATHGKGVSTQDFVPTPGEMPQMRQNVLGLDHGRIKERIQAEILKFKAINTGKPEVEEEPEAGEKPFPQKLIEFNRKEFIKFYKRNRILEVKMRKRMARMQDESNNLEDWVGHEYEEDEGGDEVYTIDLYETEDEKNSKVKR